MSNLHPSRSNKIVKYDEYKLLYNQIDRLTEVLNGINAMPQGKQIQQSQPYKPYIHRGRGYRQFPIHDSNRGSYRQRCNDRNREDTFPLDPNQEDVIPQGFLSSGNTITTIDVTAGSPDLEVYPDLLPGGQKLHISHPVEIMTDVLAADYSVILPKNVLKKTLQ